MRRRVRRSGTKPSSGARSATPRCQHGALTQQAHRRSRRRTGQGAPRPPGLHGGPAQPRHQGHERLGRSRARLVAQPPGASGRQGRPRRWAAPRPRARRERERAAPALGQVGRPRQEARCLRHPPDRGRPRSSSWSHGPIDRPRDGHARRIRPCGQQPETRPAISPRSQRAAGPTVRLRSRPRLCDDDNDVPQLLAGLGVPVRLDDLLEREAPVDDRVQPSRFDEASQVGQVLARWA